VTTRYFGGILLGTGGLVRAYTQAAQEAIAAAHVVTISRCVDVTVTIDYPRYDQLVRIAADCGAHVADTVYTDRVTLTLRMLDGTQQPLLEKISELTRGAAEASVSSPFDAAF
jgi:putative IMPACT (imprinted ancient) family translation regulator